MSYNLKREIACVLCLTVLNVSVAHDSTSSNSDSFPLQRALGFPSPPSAGVDWRDRDAAIYKAINKGDSTIAGWMNGLGQKIEAAKLFIANNNVPAAMAIDEEIRKVTNANSDSILRYSNLTGIQPGSLAERMRDIARSLRDGLYLEEKINLNGQEYSYGVLLRTEAGKMLLCRSLGETLFRLGFDRTVASMLLSGTREQLGEEALASAGKNSDNFLANSDATAKSCMKFLTDNDLKMTGVNRDMMPNDPYRVIRSGIANELAGNWKNYFLTFGSATGTFISRFYDSFRDSGGHRMMPGMRDYAVRVASKNPGLEGKALVEETFRQYDAYEVENQLVVNVCAAKKLSIKDVGFDRWTLARSRAFSVLSRLRDDFDLCSRDSRIAALNLACDLLNDGMEGRRIENIMQHYASKLSSTNRNGEKHENK